MSLHLVQIIRKFAFFVFVWTIRHQNGRFSLLSSTTEIFSEWRPWFIASSGDVALSLLLPLPTTHPKLKLATGMSAWQRPLAVQHHVKIHDYIFHPSYVAQWHSVWPRNMRSSVRITGKPMVLKVRRKIGRSWSCDQRHVWSWALDGRSVSNGD